MNLLPVNQNHHPFFYVVRLPVDKVVPFTLQQKIKFKAVMKMFGLHRKFVITDYLVDGKPCHLF